MEERAILYLIPVGMSDAPNRDVLPALNSEIIKNLKYFIVENVRSARRFIKRCDPSADISQLTFYELNRHTPLEEVNGMLAPLRRGESMGVMSDAGCPAVADPGALPVAIAQREGLTVRPLVGPSSILMGVMASGFNGQGFAFHGYLPIEDAQRTDALRHFENESRRHGMTQIFIETPYRNNRLLSFMTKTLKDDTRICVACNLTDPETEWVKTRTVASWRSILEKTPGEINLDKRPTVFLLYAGGMEEVQQTKKKGFGAMGSNRRKR